MIKILFVCHEDIPAVAKMLSAIKEDGIPFSGILCSDDSLAAIAEKAWLVKGDRLLPW